MLQFPDPVIACEDVIVHKYQLIGILADNFFPAPVWADVPFLLRHDTPAAVIGAASCKIAYGVITGRVKRVIREHPVYLRRQLAVEGDIRITGPATDSASREIRVLRSKNRDFAAVDRFIRAERVPAFD